MDYYKTLELTESATQDDIKKSYRRLAKKFHPDSGIEKDDSKFKAINEAYSVLSDECLKAKYDNKQKGNNFFNQNGRWYNPNDYINGNWNATNINLDVTVRIVVNSLEEVRSDKGIKINYNIIDSNNKKNQESLTIKIPLFEPNGIMGLRYEPSYGVLLGTYIIKNKGSYYKDVARGNLIVQFEIKTNVNECAIEGRNIVQFVNIDLLHLLFSEKVRVKTLYGKTYDLTIKNYKNLSDIKAVQKGLGLWSNGINGDYVIRFNVNKIEDGNVLDKLKECYLSEPLT